MPHKQQKENFVETFQDIQERLEREPEFLSKMITGADKTWVYGCSQETQQQSSQLKSPSSPCLHRARRVFSTWMLLHCSQSFDLWICSSRTNGKPLLLHGHLSIRVWKCVMKTTWELESGGFVSLPWQCTSSLCFVQSIWLKTKVLLFFILPTDQFCKFIFPKLETSLKRRSLMVLWFKENCELCLLNFKQRTLWNVLSSGRITGLSKLLHKLIWTKQHRLKDNCHHCFC